MTIEELTHKPEGGEDPAPYIRALNHYQIDPMQKLLKWKLSLYEEPDDPADQAMLLIDQVRQQSAGESRELGFNLLSQACGDGAGMVQWRPSGGGTVVAQCW